MSSTAAARPASKPGRPYRVLGGRRREAAYSARRKERGATRKLEAGQAGDSFEG